MPIVPGLVSMVGSGLCSLLAGCPFRFCPPPASCGGGLKVCGAAGGPLLFQLGVCGEAFAVIVEEAGEVVDGQAASEERDDELAVASGLAVEELALAFCFLALFGFLQAAAFLGGLHLSGIIDGSACHENSPVRRRAMPPVALEKGCASVLRMVPKNFENFRSPFAYSRLCPAPGDPLLPIAQSNGFAAAIVRHRHGDRRGDRHQCQRRADQRVARPRMPAACVLSGPPRSASFQPERSDGIMKCALKHHLRDVRCWR
jgi:hypothetical protein